MEEVLLRAEFVSEISGLGRHCEDNEIRQSALLFPVHDRLDRGQTHEMPELIQRMGSHQTEGHLLNLAEHGLHLGWVDNLVTDLDLVAMTLCVLGSCHLDSTYLDHGFYRL